MELTTHAKANRDAKIFQLSVRGMSYWEIAHHFQLSPQHIYRIVKAMRTQWNANQTA